MGYFRVLIFLGLVLEFGAPERVWSANCGGAVTCNCGDTVTSNYTLSASLSCANTSGSRGLKIGATNVTLNCNGYSISGNTTSPAFDSYGVEFTSGSSTLTNCTVEKFGRGVRISSKNNVTVSNSTLTNNGSGSQGYGIDLVGTSTGATIQDNSVTNNKDEGIHISSTLATSTSHLIDGNTVTGNTLEGIYLLDVNGATVSYNTLSGNGAAGIYVKDSDSNDINHNSLTEDTIHLIAVDGDTTQNTLSWNTLTRTRIIFDGADSNTAGVNNCILGNGTNSAYSIEFKNDADNNTLTDTKSDSPGDKHVKASGDSAGNTLTRIYALPISPGYTETILDTSSVSHTSGSNFTCY